jgi:hypothetical protein
MFVSFLFLDSQKEGDVPERDVRSLKKYASVIETTKTASEFNLPQVCAFPSVPPAYLKSCEKDNNKGGKGKRQDGGGRQQAGANNG